MAAYASTVTLDRSRMERISRNYGFVIGKCDITNYNTTGAEITDITKFFNDTTTPIRVINDGMSDNGYIVRWNTTDKCFHAFYPVSAHSHSLKFKSGTPTADVEFDGTDIVSTGGGSVAEDVTTSGVQDTTAQPGAEVANDVDVGEVNFVAFGLI